MSRFYGSPRSTESPMDFEYTSRPNVKPVWAQGEDTNTPRKRPLAELNVPARSFHASDPSTPTFGSMPTNIPFMLNVPAPVTPHRDPWVPPNAPYAEIKDVDMAEASPPQKAAPLADTSSNSDHEDEERSKDRRIALGGLRRVYKSRQKLRERNRLGLAKARVEDADDSEADSEDDAVSPITQNTSNHYTLNIPAPAAPKSDTPYVLLGYLQFFFNLSLILVFLYLLVQFILTVQRDVEHRIAEYSMDIVQEIAQCAIHFKSNLCATNPIPAMMHQCGQWETCMNRDPTKVGRARVGAELIAEVVNGFVEPISWKTLAFTLTSLSFLTVFVNSLLSLYRSRHNPANAPAAHPQPMSAFPITPVAPYPHHMLNAAPGWGKPWAAPGVEEIPPRRRKLENGAAKDIQ
ncbi:di-sulfide bridge nucleocytoplasmic transport domain-containing protein [Phanerochaete sordida]|uniref:Di-sulfide bridge nucleocytoplasmic transport domain-containing protein n=1 Tax=Phanerochaete sordida TaxID=48140 RepID=A0A9P3GDQ6_9APHY|nr:di-sulfide bridge nucleocytoplasmic transport domain-containing protein [Phanerochaete sordida]